MRRALSIGLVAAATSLALILIYVPPADGQSSTRVVPSQSIQQIAPFQPTFESRFWNFLNTVQYKNWAPTPGTDGKAYDGQSPHGAKLKMYLNRTAVANPKELPHGSIIVKENYGPDGTTLMAITAMYRTKGFDPDNNDWYWVKYMPNGMVARTPTEKGNMPIAGKFQSCIECHGGSDGGDLAFFNDK